jgi:hypothetical protein
MYTFIFSDLLIKIQYAGANVGGAEECQHHDQHVMHEFYVSPVEHGIKYTRDFNIFFSEYSTE